MSIENLNPEHYIIALQASERIRLAIANPALKEITLPEAEHGEEQDS